MTHVQPTSFYRWILAVLVALTLAGCGDDRPSDDQILRLINGEGDWADQYIKVRNFERVNGYAKGENQYVVQVAYDIEFLVDQKVFMEAYTKMLAQEMRAQGYNEGMIKLALMSQVLGGAFMAFGGVEQAKAGDIVHSEETYTFVKSEKGWVELEES